ncbi:hypothetical protein, partial [Aneurinibacillus aneurinilyticus]|uniref:hypothetical protein n=1 Tax=Aneurinibacillus aneurinilyticus TaxID=1391 RepID=UPI0035247F6C
GHKQGLSSPFPSGCPGQVKEDGNCLPLRFYPDVLQSRLAEAKAALDASVRETNRRPFGARCGDDSLWIILDNQHP